jgi:quinol monooxygenase YgiN
LIAFSIKIVTSSEKRPEILRTLSSFLGSTRAAAGCTQANVFTDLHNIQTLLLLEEWESRELFERNLDAAKLNALVAAIDLS